MRELTVNKLKFLEIQQQHFITGVEICRCLGYADPDGQASKIWKRHSNFLKPFSHIAKLARSDGKLYPTKVYNEPGCLRFISKCHIEAAEEITGTLIDGFILLRHDQINRSDHRQNSKMMHRELTDQILLSCEDDLNSKTKCCLFMNISKVNCKAVTGLTPSKIRQSRSTKITRDALTISELAQISTLEALQAKALSQRNLDRKAAYLAIKMIAEKFGSFRIQLENSIEK